MAFCVTLSGESMMSTVSTTTFSCWRYMKVGRMPKKLVSFQTATCVNTCGVHALKMFMITAIECAVYEFVGSTS